jgi:hypothetical protein
VTAAFFIALVVATAPLVLVVFLLRTRAPRKPEVAMRSTANPRSGMVEFKRRSL